ncbi:sigma-70 family RNA polymerase sigma factor [Glycomyces sp. NPDC021274]|uniref:sigma-70 family RNA polymerase sigma factor n=1 Tax=Glycomyces sp. NPDC021274 TaxID=3155120 RepID=UPI0033F526DA
MDAAAADRFEACRPRLTAIAYRLLGSAADAEDAVQDAFLRWQGADRAGIEVPEAWLTTTLANLCMDRLGSARVRRERSFERLPEPVFNGDPVLGPAETAQQRESVSLAMLRLMERLTPTERAVYVLREAFGYAHKEIAEMIGVSEAASQQHFHRAKARMSGAPRLAADRDDARRMVEAFLEAAATGRTEPLVALLADDATAVSDTAGLLAEPIRHVGAAAVAAYLRAAYKPTPAKHRLLGGAPAVYAALVDGAPAAVAVLDGRVVGVMTIAHGDDGRITALRSYAAPDRLARLTEQWQEQPHSEPLINAW